VLNISLTKQMSEYLKNPIELHTFLHNSFNEQLLTKFAQIFLPHDTDDEVSGSYS
jgi:hypothetical protein